MTDFVLPHNPLFQDIPWHIRLTECKQAVGITRSGYKPVEVRKPTGKHPTYGVQKIDMDTGEILETYRSPLEAQEITNINRSNICKCVNGRSKTAGGFVWRKA